MINWSDRISSKPVNFDVFLEYNNISVTSYEGFSLMMTLDLNISANDRLGIANIRKYEERRTAFVSIEGLEDPTFPSNTQGFIRRMIRRPTPGHIAIKAVTGSLNSSGNCTGVVTFNKSENDNTKILVASNLSGVVFSRHLGIILGDSADLSGQVACYVTGNSNAVNLVNQTITSSGYNRIYIDSQSRSAWSMPIADNVEERYYYQGNGPDFLMRLEGNNSPTQNGLVTFVYVPELEEQAFPIKPYSRVDYLYFSEQGDCQKVRNMPDWFGIDSQHAAEFNLTELLTGEAC